MDHPAVHKGENIKERGRGLIPKGDRGKIIRILRGHGNQSGRSFWKIYEKKD